MANNYIIQFKICLPDTINENDSIKTIQEWVKGISLYNHNTLFASNPSTNPIITDTSTMKSYS